MHSTSVEIAWAMPVDVVTFGAHLEAYVKLQPAFNALKFCNRFGKGDKAAITKLPVELVQHVESYLLEDQRAVLLPQWLEDFRCWEDRCVPMDHLSDEAVVDIYNVYMQDLPYDWDEDEEPGCACCINKRRMVSEATEEVKEYVADILNDTWLEDGGEDPVHSDHIDSWFARVGRPATSGRGSLSKFGNVLKKHFGLEVWVSHVQEDRESEYSTSNMTHSTKTYLRLPDTSSMSYDWAHHVDDYEVEPRRRPTEAGLASTRAIPPVPSEKSLARFARAVNILGLTQSQDELAKKLASSEERQEGSEGEAKQEKEKEDVEKAAVPFSIKPQLTVLVRSSDDEDEW